MRKIMISKNIFILVVFILVIFSVSACGVKPKTIGTIVNPAVEVTPTPTSVATVKPSTTPVKKDDINMIDTFTTSQQKELNIFLSNFSEQQFGFFDNKNINTAQLIDFSILYNIINDYNNNNKNVKYIDNYKCCISADIIAQNIKRFFDIDIKHRSTKENTYSDGKYEWMAATGEQFTVLSVADEMYDNGDGTYLVKFKVYSMLDSFDESAQISDFYPYIISQAEKSSKLKFDYSGTAIVKPHSLSGKKTYQLVLYKKN